MNLSVSNLSLRTNNNITFGWAKQTHSDMTKTAAENVPSLANYSESLQHFSMQPDIDDKGFYNNSHFYYDPLRPKGRKSFFDFKGFNNAYAKYSTHIENMQTAIEEKDKERAIEHAGRAMHFLQDVAQPQHVQSGGAVRKYFDVKNHIAFEDMAEKDFEKYRAQNSENTRQLDINTDNYCFHDIFFANVDSSKDMLKNKEVKKEHFPETVGKSIAQGIESSKLFLEKFADLLKGSD
jgi:hypothetical protein